MMEKKEASEPVGFYLVRRNSHEVLYLDDNARALLSGLRMGEPCYSGFGRTSPCENCVLCKLESNNIAASYSKTLGINIVAYSLPGQDSMALVCCGEFSAEQRRKWMENGRYQIILRQNNTIAFEYDLVTGEHFVSPSISEYLIGNYDDRQLSDVMIEDGVLHPNDFVHMLAFRERVKTAEKNESAIMRLMTTQGIYRWNRMSVCAYDDPVIGHIVIMGTITDIHEEICLREKQKRQAEFDEVTGIFNKAAFFNATQQRLREQADLPHNLLVFDIDRFKMVNDLFGVAEGDKLLRFLGEEIAARIKEHETYGRVRDDVFGMCVLRPDQETMELVQELGDALASYPLTFKLMFSVGICRIAPGTEEAVNILCDRAFMAMRSVKGSAVTKYAFYQEKMGEAMFREQQMIGEMHQALAQGQFVPWLQAKHDVNTGQMIGAEALVRWNHPTKGLLLPGEFVPLFERNGLISLLDEYVWEATAAAIRHWLDKGLNVPPVSINVSRVHLYDPGLCDTLIGLTERYQFSPRLLEIELTESAYVENPRLGELMEKLRGRGFVFLMDDFGSGYSSLNMLRNIPVDILKIDLHFLGFGESETSGKIILESVVQMAERLGIPVIVEGVETAEQAVFLQQINCKMAQGYYFSRPMTLDNFEKTYLLENKLAAPCCGG